MSYKNINKRREYYKNYLKNYIRKKVGICCDCGKHIEKRSKRCKSCEDKRRWKVNYEYLRKRTSEGVKNSPNMLHSEETKKKISISHINLKKKNPKLSEWNRIHNPLMPLEKRRLTFNKLNKEEGFNKLRLMGLCKKPTRPEKYVIDIITKNKLPFDYTGDGKVIISHLNPDFVSNDGSKKIIEVFSRFWHQEYKNVDFKRTEIGRKEIFSIEGYKTLIIWDDEL